MGRKMPATRMLRNPRLADGWAALLAALIAIAASAWILDPRLFFYADDWSWQLSAAFTPPADYLKLFPTQIYNDRPVGALFIKAVYSLFGLNYQAAASATLLLHGI